MDHASSILWEQLDEALRAFIVKRVSSEVETEDITQEVFLRVHRRLESLHDRERMVSWVYQIARNAIIDHYRSAKRRRELPSGLTIELEGQGLETGPQEEQSETKYALARCLRPMINRLSREYREAIMLVEMDGLTHQEAATRLGLSLPGMKSRVQRGRRQLKQMLHNCCLIHLDRRNGVADYEPRHPDSCR
jgi:RNA polymerase sigma-70 factor (ECF subfamily)